jgi:hypothetical protein
MGNRQYAGSAALSGRVEKVVGYLPLSETSDFWRRNIHEALLDSDSFEERPDKWRAAILKSEEKRPKLRIVGSDFRGARHTRAR